MTTAHARVPALVADNPLLIGVAGIGFSVSFQTVSRLAVTHGLPGWPPLYPLGIDLGILALIVESRKAIDARRGDLVPRALAWALAGITIYVNAHGAAKGDWLGIALHVVMPALWIVFLELTRWRKIAKRRAEDKRDRVPLARWLLAPAQTARLWRWMVLWQITSYRAALDREQARRRAIASLRAVHGRRWKSLADSALVWQLVHGIDVEHASEAVSALVPEASRADAGKPAENLPRNSAEKDAADSAEKPAEKPAEQPAEQPPRKPSRAQAKKMLAVELAPYVGTLLEASPGLTQQAIMDDLHVGIGKAREALRLAKHDRVVVDMSTRTRSW